MSRSCVHHFFVSAFCDAKQRAIASALLAIAKHPLLVRSENVHIELFRHECFILALRELCGSRCVMVSVTHKLKADGLERPHEHAEFSMCGASSVGGRSLAGSYAFRPLQDRGKTRGDGQP